MINLSFVILLNHQESHQEGNHHEHEHLNLCPYPLSENMYLDHHVIFTWTNSILINFNAIHTGGWIDKINFTPALQGFPLVPSIWNLSVLEYNCWAGHPTALLSLTINELHKHIVQQEHWSDASRLLCFGRSCTVNKIKSSIFQCSSVYMKHLLQDN